MNDELTAREKQALYFRHSGYTNKQTAEEMKVKVSTLKQYLTRAYDKARSTLPARNILQAESRK